MKISIIGSGYVGLVTGICFAELGNEVCFIDKDKNKLRDIEANNPPFFEPGLGNLMEKNCSRVAVADSITEGIKTADCTFICVGTPPCPDGSIDLGFVKQVALELGAVMSARQGHLVIMKSTVTPGTTENVVAPLIEEKSGGKRAEDFYIAVNPEFLREGNAVHDFFHPDRIIFGIHDMKAKNILDMLYSGFSSPKLYTTCKTAEMIKYANNAFLATKISFSNEIGNICKKIGVDAFNVFEGVGLDSRINPLFFKCGLGFGGSCFPKDVRALIRFAEEQGEVVPILHSVLEVNEIQPARMIALLRRHIPNLRDKKIGILGLSFKPETDDVRESRAVPVIRQLLEKGAEVLAYDPKAMNNFRAYFPDIRYADRPEEVLDSDAVLILTEWKVFEDLDYRDRVVIDGRRISRAITESRDYEGLCW